MLFLDSVLEKQREEERLRKEMEGEELKHFREWVNSRARLSARNLRYAVLVPHMQGCRRARDCGQQTTTDWCHEYGGQQRSAEGETSSRTGEKGR